MRPRVIQLVALLVAGGLVTGSATFTPQINAARRELTMIGPESPLEGTPPEYAFAIQAFGAFRSLIVDIAFIRAEEYKQQGRYYDAMQLANWICKLQPRFPSVWEFQSWNMAWNISVTTYTPQERWNWVYNGVKLLRDEGLRYNPRSVNLHRQLAWTFNNKMSESLDDYHLAYKRYWAWRMHLLLGSPPDPLRAYRPTEEFEPLQGGIGKGTDRLLEAARLEAERRERELRQAMEAAGEKYERPKALEEALERQAKAGAAEPAEAQGPTPYEIVKKAAYDWIKAMDDAPRSLAALYAAYPETKEMVARLREFGVVIKDDVLSEDEYWREDGLAFAFFARYRRLKEPLSMFTTLSRREQTDPDAANVERLDQIVGVREGRPAGEALVRFLQRKVLNEVYKLETPHLLSLMETFGPMDWRVVDAHSLYWVTQAIIKGKETLSTFRNDKTNTSRLIFFSLRNLYLRNKVTFEPFVPAIELSYLNMSPDPNFIEPLHQAYLTYGPLIDPDPGQRGGAGGTYRTGHINFLSEAIRILYLSDRKREAARYYEYLRDNYYRNDDGSINTLFEKPLHDYVMQGFYETVDTPRETNSAIHALLTTAYDRLAEGDDKVYNNLTRMAFDLRENFMADKAQRFTDRFQLPEFVDMRADALRDWLSQPSLAAAVTVHKARLWKVAPIEVKQREYDELLPSLTAECDYWNFDVKRAFPEPPGMKEFREQQPRRPEEKPEGVETPAQPIG